jgi:4-diphosphocytidyl-2-C-methyl-D-erythritol kinase
VNGWRRAEAPAKLNLALVVGPSRPDGKHEVTTVLERLSLCDTVAVRRAAATRVSGFADDTLVAGALEAVARVSGGATAFEAHIEKRIPVAAGLGGGSSDAATALRLANELVGFPLERGDLLSEAASLGSDVPFFLYDEPQLATGDGTTLERVAIPRDYVVLLALPTGAAKRSTADVYAAFDARSGEEGYDARRAALLASLADVRLAADLGALPVNDLGGSPLAAELTALGAFRADVTGAGPVVYGLYANELQASGAADALAGRAQTWVAFPG